MSRTKMDFRVNGTKEQVATKNYSGPVVRLWRKLEINEWTLSLSIFVLSLSIVLVKLYVNYGILDTFGALHVSNLSNLNAKSLTDAREKFASVGNHYGNVLASSAMSFFETYGWLIRAAISGMIMTGYSWYIIYMDSRIPGINPPFFFSLSRTRFSGESRIQINYLFGVVAGILVFIYMCG